MTRSLPTRPNINHLKNEAKAILKAHRAHNADVCPILKHLKKFHSSSDEEMLSANVTLLEVQQSLAVEYGFENWIHMRNHVGRDPGGINTTEMKRYKSAEWNFALDIPRHWVSFPPSPTGHPHAVNLFVLKEDDNHHLIIFRWPHDPKQSLKERAEEMQKDLVTQGFVNISTTETAIGTRASVMIDCDLPDDDVIRNVRLYHLAEGTLKYQLVFATTDKESMFELYERMAKSFEILEEPISSDMKRYESSKWCFALDIPGRWTAFPPNLNDNPNGVISFASLEGGTHGMTISQRPFNPAQSLKEHVDKAQEALANKGFENFIVAETTIASKPVLMLDFDISQGDEAYSLRHYFVADGTLMHVLAFETTDKSGMIAVCNRIAKSFEILARPINTNKTRYENAEWNFALDIPKGWESYPPVSTTGKGRQVIRFESQENGYNNLTISLSAHAPKRSLKEHVDQVQEILEKKDFMNFIIAETSIGSRPALMLDFDKIQDNGTLSCRHYFVVEDILIYVLEVSTTSKSSMFELLDSMAKSFEIVTEPTL